MPEGGLRARSKTGLGRTCRVQYIPEGCPVAPHQRLAVGKDKYEKKFAYALVSGKTSAQVLSEAETALKTMREEMASWPRREP